MKKLYAFLIAIVMSSVISFAKTSDDIYYRITHYRNSLFGITGEWIDAHGTARISDDAITIYGINAIGDPSRFIFIDYKHEDNKIAIKVIDDEGDIIGILLKVEETYTYMYIVYDEDIHVTCKMRLVK